MKTIRMVEYITDSRVLVITLKPLLENSIIA